MSQRPRLRAIPTETACPICGKPVVPKHRPFCSVRCSRIDLGRWLGEVYRVPAEPSADDEADQPRRSEDDDEH
jgi:endogenous inhibitor of DNA gyrase (YacG/DUF329 family)